MNCRKVLITQGPEPTQIALEGLRAWTYHNELVTVLAERSADGMQPWHPLPGIGRAKVSETHDVSPVEAECASHPFVILTRIGREGRHRWKWCYDHGLLRHPEQAQDSLAGMLGESQHPIAADRDPVGEPRVDPKAAMGRHVKRNDIQH
jgi:hypothetical protein